MSDAAPDAAGPPRFVALTGPTTAGKTALAEALGCRMDIEIISMDSRQVYQGMDIGTDKASTAARARIPHHGLDLVRPSERYSAGRFAREARAWILDIRARGRTPVLVGGTGFFLRALTDPIFREPPLDRERRQTLRDHLSSLPVDRLDRWVEALDPERADIAREGGRQRMARTLEIALLTGRPLSWWHREAPIEAAPVPGLIFLLEAPRQELDTRIAARVDRMFEQGFEEEVRALLERGYGPEDPGISATGYREMIEFVRGRVPLEDTKERIRSATRRYARRQMTWFRNQMPSGTRTLRATIAVEDQVATILAGCREVGLRSGPAHTDA